MKTPVNAYKLSYTHFWHRPELLNIEQFRLFAHDVQLLYRAMPPRVPDRCLYAGETFKIGGSSGSHPEPTISDIMISFNGYPHLSHSPKQSPAQEPFILGRLASFWHKKDDEGRTIQQCRTGMLPYDLMVCAVLIRFKYHFPDVLVRTDGGPSEWRDAQDLCISLFGSATLPFVLLPCDMTPSELRWSALEFD